MWRHSSLTGADHYVIAGSSLETAHLLWPPTLIVCLVPEWLASMVLCNVASLHTAHLYMQYTPFIPRQVFWAHPTSAPEISSLCPPMQINSSNHSSFCTLCTAQGLPSKFSLYFYSHLSDVSHWHVPA
jgi:hypothetical protein